MLTLNTLYEPLCGPPMGPSRKLGQASVRGGLDCDLQGKEIVCGRVSSLPVWKVRRPIGMVKSRIEETEEEFDARMAAISSEAKNANKPQAKPIESSKEVFGALFSTSSKED